MEDTEQAAQNLLSQMPLSRTGTKPSFARSTSLPVLARAGTDRAIVNLGKRLVMASPAASAPLSPVALCDTSVPSDRPLSPLSCARKLREQRAASTASLPANVGANSRNTGLSGEDSDWNCVLWNDSVVEAAIGARLLQKGDAANPFARVVPPKSVVMLQQKEERTRRLQQFARDDLARRMLEGLQSGEPMPSEVPYEDRLEQVMERKVNGEVQSMLKKISRCRNRQLRHEISSIPGGARSLSQSIVMKDYVLC